MSALNVDLDLIRKYNVAAPRYTSYPPATHFKEMPAEPLLERIQANRASTRDLSLYFHLPFCYSLCWYCGCTTVITGNQGASAKYIDYLKREMAILSGLINPERKVVQLHFGGGTPTFLLPDEIRELGRAIRATFSFAENIEAGVEIDPRRLVRDHVLALREAGFNRASMGVQDFDPKVQEAVHRIQPRAQTEQAAAWLREAGFGSLNIDLIYGLPHQTPESFEKTLGEVLELKPDRLAVFNYAHVPWMKPAQKILKALPTPETKLELLKLTVERLTSNGYVYIGMDHFARADDELAAAQRNKTLQRNFQGYSTRGQADIYAFGMSSISHANGAYWQNHKELPDYYAALDAGQAPISKGYVLTADDEIRSQVIMRLMCDMSLDYASISETLGLDFKSYFASDLASLGDLEADGLIVRDDSGIAVTDLGRLLIRNIAVRFDAYHAGRTELSFSKSI
ncbi:MAG: oxygen-independent coproporphyrinogen III oxidase [Verrucomicrobiota bacterium]